MLSIKHNFTLNHTMIRVKNPKVSIPFYEKNFGMKLIHKYDFTELKFSVYFLYRPKDNEFLPFQTVPSEDSEKFLLSMKGVCLELTHNYGSENDDNFKINNGNVEPHRGFGHIAFNVDDLETFCQKLENNNVLFKKKPHEGKMKTIAFALDPDGYWIEIIGRGERSEGICNLSQTMLRVKDPKKSIEFYCNILGMKVLYESVHSDFTNYFLSNHCEDEEIIKKTLDKKDIIKKKWYPVIELTHNHGTENVCGKVYHNGNDQPQGFGHLAFLVDNIETLCIELEKTLFVDVIKRPHEGKIKGIAFIRDPDGYWIELLERNSRICC